MLPLNTIHVITEYNIVTNNERIFKYNINKYKLQIKIIVL